MASKSAEDSDYDSNYEYDNDDDYDEDENENDEDDDYDEDEDENENENGNENEKSKLVGVTSSELSSEDMRIEDINNVIISTNDRINRFIIKRKQDTLYKILQIFGASLSKPICFPIQICIDDLDTMENRILIDELSVNTNIKKLFNCRSLNTNNPNEKNKLKNVIRQMITDAGLVFERKPVVYFDIYRNKKTKQNYIIEKKTN